MPFAIGILINRVTLASPWKKKNADVDSIASQAAVKGTGEASECHCSFCQAAKEASAAAQGEVMFAVVAFT
jgi:hypothetical protein